MERTEDTEFANKVIAKTYQERSIAHQEISLESKHGKEKDYHEKESCKENIIPNGSKVVQSVSRRTEIAEKKKEETESNKKKSDEQKTQEENQQEQYWIGKPSEKEQVRNIPNVKENIEKKERTERTENTKYANKEKKKEEFDSNRKLINEQKSEEGNQHEHNWIGKPSETKQVQNIPNTKENKEKKEKMERTEDTVPANKGIANSYQEKSKAHQDISLESKQDTKNDNEKEICKGNTNPNGSKAVIQRRTEITEKKKEETESNRKLVAELKTEDTGCADKCIHRSCQEQSKAHEDTEEDHKKESSEANMNTNESKPDERFLMTTDINGTKKKIEVVDKTEDSNPNKCNERSSGNVIIEADDGVTTGEQRKLNSHLPKNRTQQNEKKKEGSWFSKCCIIL